LEQLREHAVWAKPQELVPISRQLAAVFRQETDPIIRAEIVRVLGVYPTAESLAVLRTALGDSDSEVRIAACLGWARRKGPEAAGAMSQLLCGDVDGDVRLAAAEALGDIGDRSGIAALGSVLEDKDPAMQYRAVTSLKKITGQDLGDDVNRWREYVQNESTGAGKPVSVGPPIGRNF
jgi:HEAT repeat protein